MHDEDWWCRPAPEVAPALLGAQLTCHGVTAVITEVEAYQGEEDRACHARAGPTPRASGLYTPAGTLYVYRCYGIHDLLNVVCDRAGVPAAVLLRGIRVRAGGALVRARRSPTRGSLDRLCDGPGKLTRALAVDRRLHGRRLGDPDCPLSIVPGTPPAAPRCGPRVGVAYAGPEWAGKPWRWWY